MSRCFPVHELKEYNDVYYTIKKKIQKIANYAPKVSHCDLFFMQHTFVPRPINHLSFKSLGLIYKEIQSGREFTQVYNPDKKESNNDLLFTYDTYSSYGHH